MTTPDIGRIVAELASEVRTEYVRVERDSMKYAECAYHVDASTLEDWADTLEAIGFQLAKASAEGQQPSNAVPDGYVLVPKAEFVRALESIPVPKMSPMKQELFKAGTHAVIRAFNDVLAAAQEPPK